MNNNSVSQPDPSPVRNYIEQVVPFTAGDGLELNLIHIRGDKAPSKGPVILVHGAGVRANIFRAPVQETIVEALIAHGYDVWLENWRASIDFPPHLWTLDQAALYDHPQAVKKVVEQTGEQNIKAIIHCQGSTSFTMSAIAGLVPQVKTIVTNAVSLHPRVPTISRLKLKIAIPPVKLITQYLNPQWGLNAPTWQAKLINFLVKLTHWERGNLVSKHVSFTYGTGHPTLWNYDNLNQQTQDWLQYEFAAVPLRFFSQIIRSISKGNMLAVEGKPELPEDFAAQPPKTEARWAFFAGKDNICFLPSSQIDSYHYFNDIRQDYHSLRLIEGYGHLDIFMGKDAARDVFPQIIEELDKPY
ncbi:alpha/beta fold hydrolase [Neptunicella sp. SCSIO 80796]|uniref:alpha/beta fold hydrolase n=1 Tax=Neptunicella plasticusilytica TaxID=3117012 RepID=UPI003A4DE735